MAKTLAIQKIGFRVALKIGFPRGSFLYNCLKGDPEGPISHSYSRSDRGFSHLPSDAG